MQYALFYIDFFVNNIQKNHHLTALNGDFIIVCITFLIRPFIGLSPFLPIRSQGLYTIAICVNALYRAFSISTETIKSVLDTNASCQCPLSGFLHFYIHEVGEYSPVKPCVNALYRAFSISTLPSGNALK